MHTKEVGLFCSRVCLYVDICMRLFAYNSETRIDYLKIFRICLNLTINLEVVLLLRQLLIDWFQGSSRVPQGSL